MARAGARRRPLPGRLPRPLHHDAGREVDPDEPQEPSVRDPARHARHEHLVTDAVEEALEVDDLPVARLHVASRRPDRLAGGAAGAEAA